MRLFSSDLFRNFSIGFVLGALIVAGAHAESWSSELAPPAHAAPLIEAPLPSPEFIIPADLAA